MRCKNSIVFILIILFTAAILHAQEQFTGFPELNGPYLGQKPPGKKAEIFAPGIISKDTREGCIGFSPDGNTLLFTLFTGTRPNISDIYISEIKNGVWTKPVIATFSSGLYEGDFTFSPDGNIVYFSSQRPVEEGGDRSKAGDIWAVEKSGSGWAEPHQLKYPISTPEFHESYPSVANTGTLYFFCRDRGGFGQSDIFVSEPVNSKYSEIKNAGEKINSGYHEWDPYIEPGESYLIFCSQKPGGFGEDDFYVVFKKPDGTWSGAVNMGEAVNSSFSENRPVVSPDGKYFFFTSTKTGNRDIYWVDAGIINDLKPNNLK